MDNQHVAAKKIFKKLALLRKSANFTKQQAPACR
jgi:hypothetical protein